jgi:hypothetical protein
VAARSHIFRFPRFPKTRCRARCAAEPQQSRSSDGGLAEHLKRRRAVAQRIDGARVPARTAVGRDQCKARDPGMAAPRASGIEQEWEELV